MDPGSMPCMRLLQLVMHADLNLALSSDADNADSPSPSSAGIKETL